MDNNINENVVEAQENVAVEETVKKSGKKKFIIIGAIAAVAVVAVVLILLLGGSGNGKIELEGKTYSYSAEEGIKGVEEVCDGIVVSDGGSGKFYTTSGEVQDISGMDVLGGKYPIAYFGTMSMRDSDLALTSFNVFGEFKTGHGATHDSTKAELDKKDFVFSGDVYSVVNTNKGAIDWDDIEKDYENMVSTNSFKDIDYLDSALLVAADVTKIAVGNDDVKMLLDMYGQSNSVDVKGALMLWLAKGKAVDMLLEGEVEYVVEEGVYHREGSVNTLYIRMYTSKANGEKIKENLGIIK